MNQASRMYAEHEGRRYRVGFVYDNDCTILSKHMAKLLGPGELKDGRKMPGVRPATTRMIGCFVYDVTDRQPGDPDPTTHLAPGVKEIARGRCFCLPIDEYRRETGRRIALHRAVKGLSKPLRQALCKAYEQRRARPPLSRRRARAAQNLLEQLVRDIAGADAQYQREITEGSGVSAVVALGNFHSAVLYAAAPALERAKRQRGAA